MIKTYEKILIYIMLSIVIVGLLMFLYSVFFGVVVFKFPLW